VLDPLPARDLYNLVTMPRLIARLKDLLGDDVVCHTSAYINMKRGDPMVVAWHQDCLPTRWTPTPSWR
jgi:hypothetical protein